MIRVERMRFLESRIDVIRRRDKDSEMRKVEAEVFDESTLMVVYKLMSDGLIRTIEFPVSTGKEAIVFAGTTDDPDVLSQTDDAGIIAIKIYRIVNAEFRNIFRYIDGDPRFRKVRTDHRSLIFAWAQKEYKNLMRLRNAGVCAPIPFRVLKNVLVMEFIEYEGRTAPLLKDVRIRHPDRLFLEISSMMKEMYRGAELIHADLSEYNIMMRGDEPVFIDMAQAVLLDHPQAMEFLKRDVWNICRFFRKKGVRADPSELMVHISGTDMSCIEK